MQYFDDRKTSTILSFDGMAKAIFGFVSRSNAFKIVCECLFRMKGEENANIFKFKDIPVV